MLEPPSTTVEASKAPTTSAMLILRIRAGVSQLQRRVASQERVPVAAAPALMAPIMHCMHIDAEISAQRTLERPKIERQTPARLRPGRGELSTSRSMSRR